MPPRRLPPGYHELLIPAFFVTDAASPELARWKQEHPDWFEAGTWEQPRVAARVGGAAGQAGATGAAGGSPEAEMADVGAPPRTVPGAARVAGYFGASVAPFGLPRRRPVGAATARRLALGRLDGPPSPVIPVQFEPEPPERRAPGGRLLTPEEEIRESRFSTALDAIRRLEPNNPELTFVRDPDRTIPEESVRQVEHKAELARQRNVVVDGRVLPAEPPEKRANDVPRGDIGSIVPSTKNDALRPDDVVEDVLKAQSSAPHGSREVNVQRLDTPRADGVRGELRGSIDRLTSAEKIFVEEQLSQGKDVTIIPRSMVEGERTADFYIGGEKSN